MGQRENRYEKLLRTILVSGGATALNCAINLVLPRFITQRVGTEAYGFVTLAKNFVQYAAIVTAALNSFAARHIAVAYHANRPEEAKRYFSSTFYGDAALGLFLFLILVFADIRLDHLLNVPGELVRDVKLLFLLVSLNFLFSTLFTAFGSSAFVANQLDLVGASRVLAYSSEALVLLGLYLCFPARVSYVGLGILVQSGILIAANVLIWRKWTPEFVIRRVYCSAKALKKLVTDGIWTSLSMLGETLNNGLDLLVCNLLLSPLRMGQLAIAKTVHSLFSGLLVLVGQAFQPLLLKDYAAGDREGLLRDLKLSMKLSGLLSNIAYAGLIALGMAFYRLWVPGQDAALIYQLSLVENLSLVATGTVYPLFYIYFLTVKKKLPTLVTIAGGLLNVAAMVVLIRFFHLGVFVVVGTTTVILLVINCVVNPLYMAHVLELPKRCFYPELIRNFLSVGIMTLVFCGIGKWFQPRSWLAFGAEALLLAAAGCVIHFLTAFGREERKWLLAQIRKTVHSDSGGGNM